MIRNHLYVADTEDTRYIHKYIIENYEHLSDSAILAFLRSKFPTTHFYDTFVKTLLKKLNLKRSKVALRRLMDANVKAGVKQRAVQKGHDNGNRARPKVMKRKMNGKEDWYIRLGPNKYKKYAIWLYEQANGPFENSLFTATWINPGGPTTIENVHKIYKDKKTLNIGDITRWWHEGQLKEYIKVGEDKFESYPLHLWRLHKGDVAPGCHIVKIDPGLPTTIDNLKLVEFEGSKNLDDWFLRLNLKLLNKNKSPETLAIILNSKEELALQKLKIELNREIKALSNGKAKTTRNTTNTSMEGTPEANAK